MIMRKEVDEIQNHSDNYHIWEKDFFLFALNSLMSFLSCTKTVSVVEGRSSILIACAISKGATFCSAVARSGPREIMYRKNKMHQPSPPSTPVINARSLTETTIIS